MTDTRDAVEEAYSAVEKAYAALSVEGMMARPVGE